MYYKKYGELPSLVENFDDQTSNNNIKNESTFTPIIPPPNTQKLSSSPSSSSNSRQNSPTPKKPSKNQDVAIDLSINSNEHETTSKVKAELLDAEPQQALKPHHPIAKPSANALNFKMQMSPSSLTSALNHNTSNTSSFHVPTNKNPSNLTPNDILNSFMNPFMSPLLIQPGLPHYQASPVQVSPFSTSLNKMQKSQTLSLFFCFYSMHKCVFSIKLN
jgi:hypothetical protein